MSYLLSIETSTKVGSVAIHQNGKLLAYHENFVENSHSEHLPVTIREMLAERGIAFQQLDAVAISKGPGSYTGLRIGVSVAKGICFANDIPLIAVETLSSMAMEVVSLSCEHGLLCPMIDARRMEVYCQLFGENLSELSHVEAKIIDEKSFRELLNNNMIYFFGNGAQKCKDVLQHKNAGFIDGIYPKAKFIGELAIHKFEEKKFENLAYFEPYYLKEFIAKKPSGKSSV